MWAWHGTRLHNGGTKQGLDVTNNASVASVSHKHEA